MNQSNTKVDPDERVVVTGVRRSAEPMGGLRRDSNRDMNDQDRGGHERVHWGPVLAGVVAALSTLLLLGLLGLATGLTHVDAQAAGNSTGNQDAGRNSALWAAVSAAIAFIVGGYVAGRASDERSPGWSAFNGAMVFLVALPLMLWLAAQGAGAALGALGDLRSGANDASANGADAARAIEAARNAATAGLIGGLVGLAASTLGGLMAARGDDLRVGRNESDRKDTGRRGAHTAGQW
ncbi:MAG TPA: hypothetical protein VM052_09265 [Candidatus Limnocylindrales bacterium]|nr:hypothetical protein [Candidatus Limnocylindrales bacterium]